MRICCLLNRLIVDCGGKIVRIVFNSDDAAKALKMADDIIDTTKTIKSTIKKGNKLHKTYNPIQRVMTSTKEDIVNRAIKNTRKKADTVDFVNRIVYELKPYNKNLFKKAITQAKRYLDILGENHKIVIDMYR